MTPLVVGYLSIFLIFFMILSGFHIAVALSAVSFAGIWLMLGRASVASSLVVNTSYNAIADYVFAVVPLFVVMGLFANASGATRNLFSATEVLMRRLRGGVGSATVVANAIFAAVTGTSVASAAVFSKIAIPEMQRLGYDRKFSLGIVGSSALLGMLIPPSVLMIIYGILTEQSIGRLFAAGVVPGLLVALVLIVQITIRATLNPRIAGSTAVIQPSTLAEKGRALIGMTPMLLLILVVLGGIYAGFYTPTEAGGIGAFGAFLLMLFNRRGLPLREFYEILLQTGRSTASIFLLLIGAQMYSRMLTLSGVPAHLTKMLAESNLHYAVIIALFIVLLLLLGCLLDSISIMLLTLPIIVPVISQIGMDPIHFAMIAIVTIELGLLTPPFGLVVFAMKAALPNDYQLQEIFAGVVPFYIALLVALLIIIMVPGISLWLPNYLYS